MKLKMLYKISMLMALIGIIIGILVEGGTVRTKTDDVQRPVHRVLYVNR